MAKEPDGFQEFAVVRGPGLFRTAWLLCGDWHLAEDLVQTTFGKLYASWRKVQNADSPEAYARTVLTRTYLSHMRKRSSREAPSERLPDAAGPEPDQALRVTLLTALAKLAPQDRAVLILRYWDDQSVAEVAEATRLSSGAVRNRSMRATNRLREVLGDELMLLAP